VQLHVNPRWSQCSFQLDPSLTQQEFKEFSQEAGMVACYRPLTSASAMGIGRFEVSLLQWKTTIDETKGAWNNTFVHPHEHHYLVGGPALPIPGISLRTGLTKKIDLGVYGTLSPGANYGFVGAQVQYALLSADHHPFDLASRLSLDALIGPKDLNFSVSTVDIVASKKFKLYRDWISISPYLSTSVYFTSSHEKSELVNLKNEHALGLQGTFGAVANIKNFRLAAEYNLANVNTFSFRLGYNFKMWTPKFSQKG
jgi:hypothetical protein